MYETSGKFQAYTSTVACELQSKLEMELACWKFWDWEYHIHIAMGELITFVDQILTNTPEPAFIEWVFEYSTVQVFIVNVFPNALFLNISN